MWKWSSSLAIYINYVPNISNVLVLIVEWTAVTSGKSITSVITATTVTIAPWSPPSDHKTVNGETETNNPLNTTQYSVELATNLRKSFTISEKAPNRPSSWLKALATKLNMRLNTISRREIGTPSRRFQPEELGAFCVIVKLRRSFVSSSNIQCRPPEQCKYQRFLIFSWL